MHREPKIEGIIFDLDGTLVDTSTVLHEAVVLALCDCGVADVDPSSIANLRGSPLDTIFAAFADRAQRDLRFFETRFLFHHDAHPELQPTVFDGISALLTRLKLPLGIATTKPTPRALETLDAVGLTPCFQTVSGTDPGMSAKPSPDTVLRACNEMGVNPAHVIMIGDTDRDVGAAIAAGANAIGIRHGPATGADTFVDADHVVHGTAELTRCLTENFGLLRSSD